MPRISISIGVGPENAAKYDDNVESLMRELIPNKNVRAIGTCGLTQVGSDTEIQAFKRQIALAGEAGLPLVVKAHGALDEAFDIVSLEDRQPPRLMIRGFDGSEEQLERWICKDAYVSFDAKAADDPMRFASLARMVRTDRILIESGAPYAGVKALTGFPPRADQVVFIADALAGVCPAAQIAQNTKEFLGL